MRGLNIQYNDGRCAFFPPEEATRQNMKFKVCSIFVKNVYLDFLNITILKNVGVLLMYSKAYIGKPEVIFYSEKNPENNNIRDYYLYSKENNNATKTNSFSLKQLIPLIRPGDILTYYGHTKLIYDVEKDSNGNVIDAFIIESTIHMVALL